MSEILLHRVAEPEVTVLKNSFIDRYMLKANGEYVKLYLYLLRLAGAGKSISIGRVADMLEHTENDVKRALKYWEKQGLLTLDWNQQGELEQIAFLESSVAERAEALTAAAESVATAEGMVPKKQKLNADRIASLKNQEEVEQLLFIASQYMGKTLTPTEISSILYFYDGLHFSTDLIEYLVEYCVSKGSKSTRYMEKVAVEWAAAGVKTPMEAKERTTLYNKKYYAVLNAFGIKGRGPAKAESDFMKRWFEDYHFTPEIVEEACNRTIAQTHQPNFSYANGILERWHREGVHHLTDLRALDEKHIKIQKASAVKPKNTGNDRFNNFEPRDYDFDQLEKQLLGN